ncbi:MAG: hypothetical protein LAP21_21040 [Acidobacteriia bacterium]|nr:hypothetical protein [Terriglobia bacterium]
MRWQKIACALFAVLIAVVIIYPLFIHPMFDLTRAQRSHTPLAAIIFADFTIVGRVSACNSAAGYMGSTQVNTHSIPSASLLELKHSLLC